jgi:hypothetical protein
MAGAAGFGCCTSLRVSQCSIRFVMIYRPETQEGKGGTVPHAPLMIFVGCRSGHCCNKGEITLNL